MRQILFIVVLFAMNTWAQPSVTACPDRVRASSWSDCTGTKKFFAYDPDLKKKTLRIYEGGFRNGLFHGSGTYRWMESKDGESKFEGVFVDGRATKGTQSSQSTQFQGTCHNPSKTSHLCSYNHVVVFFKTGSRWESLSMSLKNEEGSFRERGVGGFLLKEIVGPSPKFPGQVSPNETFVQAFNQWSGKFSRGEEDSEAKPEGSVKVSFANGSEYVGTVSWNWTTQKVRLDGKGILSFPNGDRYEGDFKDGVATGIGEYFFKAGSSYKGQVNRGRIEGFGRFVFVNGRVFVGEHRDGRANGAGILYSAEGTIIHAGHWENSQLMKVKRLDPNDFPLDAQARTSRSGAGISRS